MKDDVAPAPVKTPAPKKKPAPRKGFDKGAFYRTSRMLHAYISAFAFLALMFFSFTGILLNHPTWLQGEAPAERSVTAQIPAADIAAAMKTEDQPKALAETVTRRVKLKGAYKSGEMLDGEAMLRLEGATGATDIILNLETGLAEATVQPATATSIVNDLHKGKNTGAAWRLLIDLTAILVLVLSVIGYVLFFSLRFRLKTSLVLTGVSLAVFVGIYLALVP
ncbi:MAG: PepSY-associated TM helix domain-containing protein [Caulobacter sp.]|nr:PepSY-associated TM helix domain-containing protein [Caulobacter sp.]